MGIHCRARSGILSAVPEPAVARIVCGPTPFHSPFPIPHSRLSHHPMPAYASPTPPRSGDVAGTLRPLPYLAMSVDLIVLDLLGEIGRASCRARVCYAVSTPVVVD